MATIKRAWSGGATADFDGSDGTTFCISFGAVGYEGVHVQVYADWCAGAVDDLDIKAFGSTDATHVDISPFWQIRMLNDVDPNQISFVLRDMYYVELSLKAQTPDKCGDCSVRYDAWCWSSA